MRTRSSLSNNIMDDELMSWDEYSSISGNTKRIKRYSKEEDATLLRAKEAEGHGWMYIHKALLKERSPQSLKQRYNLLVTKRATNASKPVLEQPDAKRLRLETPPAAGELPPEPPSKGVSSGTVAPNLAPPSLDDDSALLEAKRQYRDAIASSMEKTREKKTKAAAEVERLRTEMDKLEKAMLEAKNKAEKASIRLASLEQELQKV